MSLHFPGIGGRQTVALALPTHPPQALVAIAPALGLRASYYQPVADALQSAGIAAAIVELPGHGSSPVRARRGLDWGYADLVTHLRSAREALTAAVPGPPFVWLGHSLGGQLALMEGGAKGAILVASGTPYWRAFEGRSALRVRLGSTVCEGLGKLLGYYPGERVGFGGREARTLITEWASVARMGEYRFATLDGEERLRENQAPVLAVRIEGDALAPAPAIDHTLAKLGSARIERYLWTGLPPENIHNRWPRAGAFPVDRVRSFLDTIAR